MASVGCDAGFVAPVLSARIIDPIDAGPSVFGMTLGGLAVHIQRKAIDGSS